MNNNNQDRMHELFAEDPLDESDVTEEVGPDEVDVLIDRALASVDLSVLSPEAQDLLSDLSDSTSSLEPATRQRFVDAADRGMKRRREDASPLPRLLFVVRNRECESLEAVAASASTDDATLLQIERGECDIQVIGAGAVAAWIQHLGVATDVALEALRLTFLRADAERAAAAAPTELDPDQDRFVGEVAGLLEGR